MLDVSSALHIVDGASAAETLSKTFGLPKSRIITNGDFLNQGLVWTCKPGEAFDASIGAGGLKVTTGLIGIRVR